MKIMFFILMSPLVFLIGYNFPGATDMSRNDYWKSPKGGVALLLAFWAFYFL